MSNYLRFIPGAISFILFVACADKEPTTQFSRLTSAKTGISFINKNTESETDNILTFEYFYNGGGVAAGDVNNDGLTDLYFSSNQQENKLYLNKGNLEFEDVTQSAGVAAAAGWKTGVSMADINNDGWLDIYVCKSKLRQPVARKNLLYINNQDGTFSERAHQFGLDDDSYSTQAAFFDFDNDGDLDAFLLNHSLLQISNAYKINQAKSKERSKPIPYVSNNLLININGKFVDGSDQVGLTSSPSNFGLGIGLSAIEESNRRKRFHESLSNALRMLGMEPMSAEFGRGPDGMAEWHVTINHPARGIASYVVGFTADTPPYSDATLSELVNRLYRAVS